MLNRFVYKVDRNKITETEFKQILEVERSEGLEDAYSEEVMREILINDPKDDNFVCSHNGKIVGYISYNPNSKRREGSTYIISLVVIPEYRRQGIAQELIYSASKYYLEKGEPKIMSLQVDKDNYPAINLYKKVGFEIVEPICELDEDDDQYIMAAEVTKIINTLEVSFKR